MFLSGVMFLNKDHNIEEKIEMKDVLHFTVFEDHFLSKEDMYKKAKASFYELCGLVENNVHPRVNSIDDVKMTSIPNYLLKDLNEFVEKNESLRKPMSDYKKGKEL